MSTMAEFVEYVQSIVKSCAGFIKTDGNFLHVPGTIYMISDDCTVLSKVNIPLLNQTVFGGNINTFLKISSPEDMENITRSLYPLGNNLLMQRMIEQCGRYDAVLSLAPIEYEEDCTLIPYFDELSQDGEMNPLKYMGGTGQYILYISKWLLPMNKGDLCKLSIYNNGELKTVCFTVHKKKMKLDVQIMYNIIPYAS